MYIYYNWVEQEVREPQAMQASHTGSVILISSLSTVSHSEDANWGALCSLRNCSLIFGDVQKLSGISVTALSF